jgi:hypothetical protein
MPGKLRAGATLLCGLTMAVGVFAAPQGKSKKESGQTAGQKIREVLPEAERVFSQEEITLVRSYFHDNRSGLPPGLAKREKLPPGLERQLRQNGTLPPGLQKKVHPLPLELERQMRRLPTGYRRVVIAGNVIMMNEKTAVIYDIVRNVIQ